MDRRPRDFGLQRIFRTCAGELAGVYPAYRWAGDDGSRLLSLQERFIEEFPLILYNEIIVLIATAEAGRDIVRFDAVRAAAGDRGGGRGGGREASSWDGSVRLAGGTRVVRCSFPVADLAGRSRERRRRAREMFVGRGWTVERIAAALARLERPAPRRPSLLAAGTAGTKEVAVSVGAGRVLEMLRSWTTFEALASEASDRPVPPDSARRAVAALLEALRRRGLLEVRSGDEAGPDTSRGGVGEGTVAEGREERS